jgi:putative addiction module antidote
MKKTKVRKIGNSYGIVLPRETLNHLKVKEGDTLYLAEAPESGLNIAKHDALFEQKIAIAEDLMQRYRNALRELAK